MGDPAWDVTEVGLIARVGAGPELLAAYGAVEAGADAYAVVAPGVSAVIAATVDVVVSAAAVAVTVTPDVTVAGASTFAALLDTPGALAPLAYYRGAAGGLALEARTAAQVLADLAALVPRAQLAQDTNFSSVAVDLLQITLPPGWIAAAGFLGTLRNHTDVSLVLGDGTALTDLSLLHPASFADSYTGRACFYASYAGALATTVSLRVRGRPTSAVNIARRHWTFLLAIPPV